MFTPHRPEPMSEWILKFPFSPQSAPHEFLTLQKSFPPAYVPAPKMTTAWFTASLQVLLPGVMMPCL